MVQVVNKDIERFILKQLVDQGRVAWQISLDPRPGLKATSDC